MFVLLNFLMWKDCENVWDIVDGVDKYFGGLKNIVVKGVFEMIINNERLKLLKNIFLFGCIYVVIS